ncbi:polysaccharide lyase family 8 super-sandwich domain-containing protein [Lacrimispora saccharolytica]|uniref:Hyaluronate lyase n=1 Tax=Lacrimispora saccharolytica (strain ATCC 35040 / DSM 2544 / NRCC 2533 / WM1) TaxID=610130 RepID=D9R556_LACSW|nr:polysaccharide lyase family 8 super-sandwich domain-containing protein [Lacrimispora saccharolytica]ADL05163.1 Hyaluronate lyase [[Clostridium] saccharolyticum WM1]QRV20654.1 DNRLRE domain-containing protein [Lacrimispora saccharolytica]
MKVKRKRFCCAVLAYLMLTGNLMGNIAYGALLPGGSAGERDQMNLETILNDGLVMHSSFDESSISGNKVKDQTGRGNNGTIYGQPDFVKGILGNGVSMDNGSRAGQANTKADQYISYGQTTDLTFGTGDFSLSFWMKTENHGQNNGTILSNKNYLSGSNTGWAFGNFNNASNVDLRMNFSGTGNSRVELKGIPANDDKWHHVTGSFDREGDMTVYLDGEKYLSTSMTGHKGKSVDTGLDFILGGDGRGCYGMSGCIIDELRVYNKAVDASAVKIIYEAEGVMAAVEQMETRLASIRPGSQYPMDQIQAMEEDIQHVKNGLESMTASAAMEAVSRLKERFHQFLEGREPIGSFQVVSDVHIKSGNVSDANGANFIAGLKDMKAIDPDSLGLLNLGDFTQSSTEAQYHGLYTIMDQYSPVTDDKVIITLGNHDVRGYHSADWNKDESVISAYWPAAKALYLKNNKRYMPGNGQSLYFDKWLGGYHFIVINTENGLKDAMYLSPEQLNWLDKTLAENASPDKPIFVMGHNALKDTHWRSNILLDFGNQDAKVKEIFAKYPQVIYMSGHIHNGFGVAEAIDREYGIMIDVPSYNESENGRKEAGIGYHVKIYEDSVIFKARNFKTSVWLPEYDITVALPGLPAVYKQAKCLNPGDYETVPYGKVRDLMEEGRGIFKKVYDQSKLTYENVGPPEVRLFPGEVRDRVNELAAGLSAAMEGLTPVDSQFQELRNKWLYTLLGGELDTGNEAVRTYLKGVDEKAEGYWNTMNKGNDDSRINLWDDLDMSFIKGTGAEAKVHSGNVAQTFYRLKDIAIAWATKGCRLYQKEEVKHELILALDFMNEHHYSSSNEKTPVFGNWWHWEIGGPIAFLDTALILYKDLTPGQLSRYAAAVNRFTAVCDRPSGYPGSPAMTGANLIDKGMVVVQTGLLTDNREKLDHVKKAYKTVFKYVTGGDGFYEDGSFIQHQALAYMGGYGSQLYEKLSILFSVFSGTDFELTYEDHAEQLIYDMIFEGIEPFIYHGLCMDLVSGRDITRKTSNDKTRGAGIMDSMMLMGDAMPAEQQSRFNRMMKYFIGLDEDFYYSRSTHIASLMKANEIMNDASIEPRSEYVLHKLFAGMDKLVHIMPEYGFALSMHSSRTYGHEWINDEGKRTWNISDGMTYLYNSDRDQYGEGYWATVDPKRLAGITTEYVTRPNGAGDRTKNSYSWVGGSSVGNYGSAGMHYKTLGSSGSTRSGTDAKKSWFMFDDEIAAVGSGITSSTGNYVETIIDNRKLQKDGSNQVLIDGVPMDIRNDGGEGPLKGTKITGTSWIHLEGNTEGSDIGYYFPGKADVMALKEKRTGNWNAQGTTEGEETNQFATFWLEHGKKPVNGSYSYVILPGRTAEETARYGQSPDIEILECSEDAHAVRETNLGITAVNFWNNKTVTAAGITSDKAASVTVQINGDEATIGVSDPTQENNGTIELSLPYIGGDVKESDLGVEVLQKVPFMKLAVKTAGLAGRTRNITIKVLEPETCEIMGLSGEFSRIKAEPGTKFVNLQLPETVEVYDNAGGIHRLEIVWERGDYQKDVIGTYELAGHLVLPQGLYNTAGFTASIQVQVGEEITLVMDDVYVQGGTDGDKNFSGSASLIVKNDAGAQNYTRKSLMKFSLDQMKEIPQAVYLTFELTDTPSTDFAIADIYQVENDWKGTAVTFNSFPPRTAANPVASFTKAMAGESLIQKLDVTDAVCRALTGGDAEISFEISIPTAAKNNYAGIHSSRTVKEGAQKPSLKWEPDYVPERIIKKNLNYIIDLASNIKPEDYTNVDEISLAQMIDEGKQILLDPDAEMEEIHEMERRLTREMVKYRRRF